MRDALSALRKAAALGTELFTRHHEIHIPRCRDLAQQVLDAIRVCDQTLRGKEREAQPVLSSMISRALHDAPKVLRPLPSVPARKRHLADGLPGEDTAAPALAARGGCPSLHLHVAVQKGNTSEVLELVLARADVNESEPSTSPMAVGAAAGQAEICQTLLTAQASFHRIANDVSSPLRLVVLPAGPTDRPHINVVCVFAAGRDGDRPTVEEKQSIHALAVRCDIHEFAAILAKPQPDGIATPLARCNRESKRNICRFGQGVERTKVPKDCKCTPVPADASSASSGHGRALLRDALAHTHTHTKALFVGPSPR